MKWKLMRWACSQEELEKHIHRSTIASELKILWYAESTKKGKYIYISSFKHQKQENSKKFTNWSSWKASRNIFKKLQTTKESCVFCLMLHLVTQRIKITLKERNCEVSMENLFHESKGQTQKVIIFPSLTWDSVTSLFLAKNYSQSSFLQSKRGTGEVIVNQRKMESHLIEKTLPKI